MKNNLSKNERIVLKHLQRGTLTIRYAQIEYEINNPYDVIMRLRNYGYNIPEPERRVNKKTGKPQMGTNVADELGRARQVFNNRIILLLETGLEAHTNIGGIVRARFMPQSMDKAFTKIVRELKRNRRN